MRLPFTSVSLVAVSAAAILGGSASSAARATQVELPQPSPRAVAVLDVGVTEVRIDYHRPAVKGREIWGKLVPYGEVWRLGANNATKLSVSDPFTIGGKELPAGSYALFAIPSAMSWKVIVNSDATQWGAYFHQPEKDLVTFEVVPQAAPFSEWMSFSLTPTSPGRAEVVMTWEKLRLPFEITVDVNRLVWSKLESALADPAAGGFDPWEVYYQAAKYSLATGERKADAFVWAERAMATKESFRNYEIKADLLARDGRHAEAIPLLDRAIELSKAAGAPEAWRDGARAKRASWVKAGAQG